MLLEPIDGLPVKTKIKIQCDGCGVELIRSIASWKERRKINNSDKDYCRKCGAKTGSTKRPQNTKAFWSDPERKRIHGEAVKNSEKYAEGISNRPSIVGENNPMWGKEHTDSTKLKMSKVRTGKTGENATAWKGGKTSLNYRVKSALQRRFRWFHRVMDRDNCTCQHCGATKNLDAHHIEPISLIIKRLLTESSATTESEKIDWLLDQPEIIDEDLTNGLTLCRTCHKKVHTNWGSHEPKVLQ